MSVDTSALQDAVGQLLADNLPDVKAVLGATDPEADYPYQTIGEHDGTDASTQCVDGASIVFPIHTYTKENGFSQVKAIDAAVIDLLDDNQFTVPGHRIVSCFYRGSRFMRDPQRGIRHGITEFDIEIEDVTL